ncbi:uncharacterized protein MELLADRAFT_66624 [Melampsora larici-populina 98AG31]|uniref:Helitron helicase-like domain-containing protein n=1 Tax=Melampsora larici-populina (strain 98AG31 / pathotype 3-4-7) TaxID=747676 RepID=F4RZZ2_MELLP|nr:uncharacterized protein MELLADRAFT_66624 [Melampsora larici-populina 98AG31]EGG02086.1 hypothetical protein MELLADRAFT_66624 [Melampsora larici-populina 98AG31]
MYFDGMYHKIHSDLLHADMSVPPGPAAITEHDNTESKLLERFKGALPHKLGPANITCQYCFAYRWSEERTKAHQKSNSRIFQNCCKKGDVTLPLAYFEEALLPQPLMDLYTGTDTVAQEFQTNIATYNNLVSFASLGAKIDNSVNGQKGTYTFRINGQLNHNIGSLLPVDGEEAAFAQIFIVGDGGKEEVSLRERKLINPKYKKQKKVNRQTLRLIQDIINKENPYAVFLKGVAEIINSDKTARVILKSLPPGKREMKTYNKPRPEDVAALIQGNGEVERMPRDVLLRHKDGFQDHITDLNSGYMGLRYPLMLPYGSQQWDGMYESPTKGTNPGYYEYFTMLITSSTCR